MKLTAKRYAEVLYSLLEGTPEAKLKAEIKKFIAFLIKNKQLRLWKRIVHSFSQIYNQKQGIVKVRVTTPIQLEKNFATKSFPHKKVELDELEDKSLIGGIILQVDDLLVDGTIKNKLNNLYRQLCQ